MSPSSKRATCICWMAMRKSRPASRCALRPADNRDMMIVLVRSRGETWCHLADLVPYALQVTPTWVSAFDLFPMETIASRSGILGARGF